MSVHNRSKKSYQQKGGASTDYSALFYSVSVDPGQLSRYTLQNIDQAPMFRPLEVNTIIPTPTLGSIIPTGAYYDSIAPLVVQNSQGPPVAQYGQLGGRSSSKVNQSQRQHGGTVYYTNSQGKAITNPWIAHVYKFADSNKINYGQALKHPKIKIGYKKVTKKAT
jgi:hypothetical protein